MEGIVELVNGRRGLLGVLTRRGYTVIEVLRDVRIGQGDRISWSPERQLGKGLLVNHTRGDSVMEVYFQNHFVTPRKLHKALGF